MMNNRTNLMEIEMTELARVTGGQVNKNPNPGKMDPGIDQIINGKNYDAVAQKIADWLNGDTERTRPIDNSQDINDFII